MTDTVKTSATVNGHGNQINTNPKPAVRTPSRQQGQTLSDVNKGPGPNADVAALMKAAEGITIESGEDLNGFLDAMRQVLHRSAVMTSMAGGELVANVRAQAKNSGRTSMIRPADLGAIRRVSKQMDRAASGMGDAASSLIAAWTAYQAFCEQIAERQGKKIRPIGSRKFNVGIG